MRGNKSTFGARSPHGVRIRRVASGPDVSFIISKSTGQENAQGPRHIAILTYNDTPNEEANACCIGGFRRVRYGTEPNDLGIRCRYQSAFSAISRPCIKELELMDTSSEGLINAGGAFEIAKRHQPYYHFTPLHSGQDHFNR